MEEMDFVVAAWMWGAVMCKVVSYIQGVAVTASVHSLVAVSFDRFV